MEPGDSRLRNGRPFKVFQFQAQPGRRYVATMASQAFDPYLVLARTNGGLTEYLKEDDDSGGGNSARLRFTVPERGVYLLVARGLTAAAAGSFNLRLEDGGMIAVPAPVTIRSGESVQGTLTESDGLLYEEDKNYDLYRVRGAPGEDVQVVLTSTAFDTFLESGEMAAGGFQREQYNDDAEGTDSALRLRLDTRGEALVRVTSLRRNVSGAYSVSVRSTKLPSGAKPPPRPGDVNGAVIRG
jgi:hypothetical protein